MKITLMARRMNILNSATGYLRLLHLMPSCFTNVKTIGEIWKLTDSGICVICDGEKIFLGHTCTFCNGTGEWNEASESYLKDHICQCIIWGRKFCPVCGEICHHDSSSTPKCTIDSGYGGMSNVKSNPEPSDEIKEESLIAWL